MNEQPFNLAVQVLRDLAKELEELAVPHLATSSPVAAHAYGYGLRVAAVRARKRANDLEARVSP